TIPAPRRARHRPPSRCHRRGSFEFGTTLLLRLPVSGALRATRRFTHANILLALSTPRHCAAATEQKPSSPAKTQPSTTCSIGPPMSATSSKRRVPAEHVSVGPHAITDEAL